jgi:sulfur carrier protein ThiS adenylyltransferase
MLTNKSKIVIVGCGGLGSNVASYLARYGFVNIIVIDFDVVSASNLNRQFYFYDQIGHSKVDALKENLLRISNNINVINIPKKINSSNIDDYLCDAEIILECVDDADVKKMIVNYAFKKNKVVIAASGICETCVEYPINVYQKAENFFIVGDGKTDIRNGNIPKAAKVAAVAAYQADLVISFLK